MKRILNKHLWRQIAGAFFGAVIFGAAFLVFGFLANGFFVYYYPQNNYYIEPNPLVVQPVMIESCQPVFYKGSSVSLIDFTSQIAISLNRVDDGGRLKSTLVDVGVPITWNVIKGTHDFQLSYMIPCNLPEGDYFLSSVIPYRDNNSISRLYPWTSGVFTVKKNGQEGNNNTIN